MNDTHQSAASAPVAAPGVLRPEVVVPAGLLDGGEIVILAVKPSLWFIPIVSLRWLAVGALLCVAAHTELLWSFRPQLLPVAASIAIFRVGYATLQWVSRYYVLTNRRVMRIRGVLSVELFECPLSRIAGTSVVVSPPERLTRTGTIRLSTVAGGPEGRASWRTLARPWEVHEQLRAAIDKACGRGNCCG